MTHNDELDALAATPVVLGGLLDSARSSQPAGDEGWMTNEIVAHLKDCEEYFLQRCLKMLQEEEPFLAAFDQEELARERDYRSTDALVELRAFAEQRRRLLDLLAPLDDAAWLRPGHHEVQGRITIESQIRHVISHDLVHLRQTVESLSH